MTKKIHMTPERYKVVSNQIESLCEQGCNQVSELLDKAENGSEISELSEFSRNEVNVIIDELSEIMSVYDKHEDTQNSDKKISFFASYHTPHNIPHSPYRHPIP